MEPLLAIVLAGGRSTRFGSDKTAVTVGDETVLARLLRLLAQLDLEIVVIGGSQALPAGVRRVPDREPGGGPVQALAGAVAHCPGTAALVLACDLPLVTAPLLAWLARPLAAGIAARVPRLGGYPQPLAAQYGPAAMAAFAQAHAAGRRAVREVLAELAIEWVDEAALSAAGLDPHELCDFDTPAQWQALAVRCAPPKPPLSG